MIAHHVRFGWVRQITGMGPCSFIEQLLVCALSADDSRPMTSDALARACGIKQHEVERQLELLESRSPPVATRTVEDGVTRWRAASAEPEAQPVAQTADS